MPENLQNFEENSDSGNTNTDNHNEESDITAQDVRKYIAMNIQ